MQAFESLCFKPLLGGQHGLGEHGGLPFTCRRGDQCRGEEHLAVRGEFEGLGQDAEELRGGHEALGDRGKTSGGGHEGHQRGCVARHRRLSGHGHGLLGPICLLDLCLRRQCALGMLGTPPAEGALSLENTRKSALFWGASSSHARWVVGEKGNRMLSHS